LGVGAEEEKRSKFKIPTYRFPLPPPDPQSEAEVCSLKAITIALQQGAKSFELRATMSLARLWQRVERGTEVQQRLTAIYNEFTEGFDARDLQEAKALLEELNQSP
jgi:predicted ATPase